MMMCDCVWYMVWHGVVWYGRNQILLHIYAIQNEVEHTHTAYMYIYIIYTSTRPFTPGVHGRLILLGHFYWF